MQLSELNQWVTTQQDKYLKTLKTFVEMNTYTANVHRVDEAMDRLCEMVEHLDFHVEVISGRHRLIRAGNGKGKRILLLSHIDTVHPPDGDFLHFETQSDGYVRGPGVGDMKGGLLMGLWTLLAMRELREDFDAQMVVCVDEEAGSPTLRDWYLAGKSGAQMAIGLEPGFPQGNLEPQIPMGFVMQRKGSGRIRFTVKGRASHAGGAPEDGLSAIEGMSHRIQKIHALASEERGITTNVGLLSGGTAANTVAELCSATIDFRFLTQADGEYTRDAIHEIVHDRYVHNLKHDVWDTIEHYSLDVFMPPMEKNDANQPLVDLVMREADRLGLNMIPIARGGGSDANYVSGSGVPSICGMGAPAEGIHTSQERILVPLLFQRLELLISTVYHLTA